MFDKNDISQIDRDHFQVIEESCYHIVLKSKNTGHTWDITCRYHPGGRSLIVNHKHKDSDPYHEQPGFHPLTIKQAQDMIKNHDAWVMETKNNKQTDKTK